MCPTCLYLSLRSSFFITVRQVTPRDYFSTYSTYILGAYFFVIVFRPIYVWLRWARFWYPQWKIHIYLLCVAVTTIWKCKVWIVNILIFRVFPMQLLLSEPCNLHFGLHALRTWTINRSDGPLKTTHLEIRIVIFFFYF